MKKIILGLCMLALCICIFTSCEADIQDPPSETTDSTPTTDTPTTDEVLPPDDEEPVELLWAFDNKHLMGYGFISTFLSKYGVITLEQYNEWSNIFEKSYIKCYGTLIEYYGITREQYVEAAEKYAKFRGCEAAEQYTEYLWSKNPDGFLVDFFSYYDVWFSEDYDNHDMLVHPDYVKPEIDSVKIRCETDDVHMDVYYTIDRKLITYVGLREFNKFKEEFGGTEKFNIIYFLEYFDIDREEFLTVYPDLFKPYNPDYIYTTVEIQEKYFCRHPING